MTEQITSHLESTIMDIVKLKLRKQELEMELREVSRECLQLQHNAVDKFADQGVKSVYLPNGLRAGLRFYLHVNKKAVPQSVLCNALAENGLGHCVVRMAQPMTLKSAIGEIFEKARADGCELPPGTAPLEALPEAVRGMLSIYEEARIVVTGLGLVEE